MLFYYIYSYARFALKVCQPGKLLAPKFHRTQQQTKYGNKKDVT